MREVAQAQKALRAVLQRFAKRSAHVATFRCVGAALGALVSERCFESGW